MLGQMEFTLWGKKTPTTAKSKIVEHFHWKDLVPGTYFSLSYLFTTFFFLFILTPCCNSYVNKDVLLTAKLQKTNIPT